MHILKIKILESCPNKDDVRNFYQNKVDKVSYVGDCGVDLIFPSDEILITNTVTKCGMGIACEFIPDGQSESGAFDLVARSSISATPLILTNSVGIIDPGYRGEIIAAFRCFIDRNHKTTVDDFKYLVEKGSRLVQIVAPDRKPIKVLLVDELTQTERGSNGFGSTNSKI
jgi:dUTP pyrophosphatase